MKKILLLLFAVITLQGWAYEDVYDFSSQQAMLNNGFTQNEIDSYAQFQSRTFNGSYGSSVVYHFGLLHSGSTYCLSGMNASYSQQYFGEAFDGYIHIEANEGYVITNMLVETPSDYTAQHHLILDDSGEQTGSITIMDNTIEWYNSNGVSHLNIRGLDTYMFNVSKITVTYDKVMADVDINEENFPDTFFRNYVLQWLDYNHDGKLQRSEATSIAGFDGGFNEKGITSLKGIEYFTEILTLSATYNQFTELDLSKNTKLQKLNLEGNHNLTSLDLSANTELLEIHCPMCGLTALDVSALTKLTLLCCSYNQISSLNVNQNTALVDLDFTNNTVNNIDLSQNSEIEFLNCGSNQLTSLNLFNNSKLRQVNCQDNQISELNFSNKPDLVGVNCYDNQIKLAAMTQLVNSLRENDIPAPPFLPIDVLHKLANKASEGNEFSPELALLCLNKGWKPSVWDDNEGTVEYAIEIKEELFPDANFRTRLHQPYIDKNRDGWLQMSELTVTDLDLADANIASLKGIEFFPLLEAAYISNNQITTVDFSGNQRIRNITCNNNQLKGKGVDDMIASLPTLPAYSDAAYAEGDIYAMWHTGEGNAFNTIQVDAAAAKGWVVRLHDEPSNGWGPYAGSNNIAFVSERTKAACVSRFDTNGDGELSLAEAAAVTKTMLGNNPFHNSDSIDYFDEFKYFTGLGTSLPNQAFYTFKTLKTITLPEDLTSTSSSCFQGCSALERATLPSTLKTIDMLSFQSCTSLESIDLPEGLTHITTQVFYGASALKRLDLPSTMQYIGQNACAGCVNLEEVTYSGSALKVGDRAFRYCSKLATFPFEHVTSINYMAFENTALTYVTIPETCTNIGHSAFNKTSQSQSCTVELLRYHYDVYDSSSENISKEGLHLPIVNSNSAMYIDRGYFHEAYNVTTQGCTEIQILIPPVPSGIAFFSCEKPMQIVSSLTKAYYIESFDQQRRVFVAKPINNDYIIPDNTGVILKGLYTKGVNHFMQAANDSQYYPSVNLLSPVTEGDTIVEGGQNVNFMWDLGYSGTAYQEGDELSVFAMVTTDPVWVGEGSCYLTAPPSIFGNVDITPGTKFEVVFEEEQALPGDANEDYSVDVLDVTTIINYIIGKNPSPFNFVNADVNGDNSVNVMDVTALINMIIGN